MFYVEWKKRWRFFIIKEILSLLYFEMVICFCFYQISTRTLYLYITHSLLFCFSFLIYVYCFRFCVCSYLNNSGHKMCDERFLSDGHELGKIRTVINDWITNMYWMFLFGKKKDNSEIQQYVFQHMISHKESCNINW